MVRVYLAGCTDEIEYRKEAKEKYGNEFDLVDPMETIPDDIREIPKRDFELIDSCDCILAYINKASFGTAMEILYSYENFILCVIVNPDLRFKFDPWIFNHCKFVTYDLENGFNYIRDNISMRGEISENSKEA